MWHPNVFPDGRVCISILHSPGDDEVSGETAAERWSPVQTVETIMISIISILASPNDMSPANVDAAKQWREDPAGFKRRVASCVRKSQEEM
jgi:ubiquitin-conjugating enzyme E2 G1